MESFFERSHIKYELILPSTALHFPRDISTALFRILQEALINVSRHSGATTVMVTLVLTSDAVTLKIVDNGTGIAAQDARHKKSLGLVGMRERAIMIGGKLNIQSKPGACTRNEYWFTNPLADKVLDE